MGDVALTDSISYRTITVVGSFLKAFHFLCVCVVGVPAAAAAG